MAALLSSWWSGKSAEEKEKEEGGGETKEEEGGDRKEEEGGERKEASSEKKESSWVSGLEGLVKNVSEYAATVGETVKTTVQDTPSFMNQFQDEQDKFTREKRRLRDAAVPPWVGYNEEEQMKAQIMELSADSRNVLRNPPPGVQFSFDFAKSYPVAMALLKEDSRLQKLRFDLVPKKVSERKFWYNYFYRVFLIKQSSQLASLATEKTESLSSDPAEDKTEEKGGVGGGVEIVPEPQTPGHEEFASDALQPVSTEINRETMQAELGQLGMTSREGEGGGEDVGGGEGEGGEVDSSVWEEQLQQELQELELQGMSGGGEGGGGEEVDSEAWEAELQEMLNMHSQEPTQD